MLVILICAVFAIELSVMTAFTLLPPIPSWLESLLDASILVALLFPTLHHFVFQPLSRLIEQNVHMEEELLLHHDHLEELVARRTEQVNNYVKLHEEEDELAAYVMERYLNASQEDPRVGYLILSASHHFSGDAISVVNTPDGGLSVMMLDAMGHGLAAAINALPAIQGFYAMSRKGMPLDELIPEINDKVRELSPPGRFLAGTFLHLDPSNSRLSGWIGGTPKIYLKTPEETLTFKSGNLSLGVLPSSELDFEFFSAPWCSQSLLVTCTDGVLESQGRDGNDLGENWMYGVIQKYGNTLDKTLFDKVWKEGLGGNKPHDDASILIINQAIAKFHA
jgi:serine phosphatase RsbU (regulator of sigma subunit)